MLVFLTLLSLLFLLPTTVSASIETIKVVGGRPFEEGSVPWLVRLDGEIGPCSGVLLAPSWVLTAAHCEESAVTAMVGAVDIDEVVPRVEISEWFPHPGWDGRDYDVALARLSYPVWGVEGMPLASEKPSVGIWLGTVGGWGERAYTGDYPYLDVPEPGWAYVDEIVDCQEDRFWSEFEPSTSTCVLSYQATICNGDSGSPLIGDDGRIYGLAVRGYRGCDLDSSTLYVDTTNPEIRNWIHSVISGSIVANMEWPSNSAEGVEIVGGWAFSVGGEIDSSVSLWIDDIYAISLPCCYDRGDVVSAYPEASLLSGFAGLYSWTKLAGLGSKLVSFRVRDSQGNELRLERTVLVKDDTVEERCLVD